MKTQKMVHLNFHIARALQLHAAFTNQTQSQVVEKALHAYLTLRSSHRDVETELTEYTEEILANEDQSREKK